MCVINHNTYFELTYRNCSPDIYGEPPPISLPALEFSSAQE